MSYEERGAWVYLAAVLGTYSAYLAVILGRARGVPLAEVAYVAPMLWAIGIAVVLSVLGRVGVEIVRPGESYQRDARDRDIDRYGEHVGFYVLSVASLPVLVLTMLESAYFWIANAAYAALVLSTLTSTVVKLGAYRRGL